MICIEIAVDDNGQVSVGVCPPEEEAGEKEYMQPAQSIDEALSKAAEMLQGPQAEGQAQAQAQESLQTGFRRARGGM